MAFGAGVVASGLGAVLSLLRGGHPSWELGAAEGDGAPRDGQGTERLVAPAPRDAPEASSQV